jgi:small subunit ribosomal protein S6
MPDHETIYDLMLLLSTNASEEQRAKVLADVESAITGAGGSISHNADWGVRGLAYEIDHQPDAEYHLLQFTAPPTLLDGMSQRLRITDGVLRFRIIKVRPGTPPAPTVVPAHASPAAAAGEAGE